MSRTSGRVGYSPLALRSKIVSPFSTTSRRPSPTGVRVMSRELPNSAKNSVAIQAACGR